MVNADGLIDEVWTSDGPIEPDPCLESYAWADGLAKGECDAADGGQRVHRIRPDGPVVRRPADPGRLATLGPIPDRRRRTRWTYLEQLFIGLSLASILLLVALGLTFTFGQMGVINMAHGEFIMAGAYIALRAADRVVSPARPARRSWSPPGRLRRRRADGPGPRAAAAPAHLRPAARHAAGHLRREPVLQQVAQDLFGAPTSRSTTPDVADRATSSWSA